MRNTTVTDYIPAGYTFNLADNPGWAGVAPNPTYLIAGPIMPGVSQMFALNLRIQQTTGGEKDWINYAEITDTYNNDLEPRNTWDIDSNPGSNGAAENAVEPEILLTIISLVMTKVVKKMIMILLVSRYLT